MKKTIKGFADLWLGTLLMGFVVDTVEKSRERKQGGKRTHRFFGPYEAYFKRPLDFSIAFMGLLVLLPFLCILALLVGAKLGRPILFTQERPGRIYPGTGKEKIFKLYKFRSMTDKRDENGELLPDEDRLTRFGEKLRSSSLDELPELFNILKGEMSLVGPRPLLVEYLPRYNERQARRHEVRPGLTGLAQVSGRNSLSWEKRFEDDVRYVDHITFLTDVKILLETVGTVFRRKGIHSDTSVTMEAFTGSGESNTDKLFG